MCNMSMLNKMKKKALKATNSKRSNKVVKKIITADKKGLYYSNKDIIEQNKIERIENMQEVIENDHFYNGDKKLSLQNKR